MDCTGVQKRSPWLPMTLLSIVSAETVPHVPPTGQAAALSGVAVEEEARVNQFTSAPASRWPVVRQATLARASESLSGVTAACSLDVALGYLSSVTSVCSLDAVLGYSSAAALEYSLDAASRCLADAVLGYSSDAVLRYSLDAMLAYSWEGAFACSSDAALGCLSAGV